MSLTPISDCPWRRRFSKILVISVVLLIFAGGMVTSTGSGLAVPDWPLSYGMLFPPMVGGVFYEHGHRMIASVVGLFTLILAIWTALTEARAWVRKLAFLSLVVVIAQGLLGGLTVLYFLPKSISISHAVLAQTFFCLVIFYAYSQSVERAARDSMPNADVTHSQKKAALVLATVIYLQLLLGAIMRHTHSGLAVPDFPTMGWGWTPIVSESMLVKINYWRFEHGLTAVTIGQIYFHVAHRLGAVAVLSALTWFNVEWWKNKSSKRKQSLWLINAAIGLQVTLGILTIWTGKAPIVTSFHVVNGAICLGLTVLAVLRVYPTTWKTSA
jgi:cytochrome c oxidase assembly protein subunit 15